MKTVSLLALVTLLGCGSEESPPAPVADTTVPDTGPSTDGAAPSDTTPVDAASEDVAEPDAPDVSIPDTAEPDTSLPDVEPPPDVEEVPDASPTEDIAPDVGVDVGPPPEGCCDPVSSSNPGCPDFQACYAPTSGGGFGQCMGKPTKKGCTTNASCPGGYSCKGFTVPACGEGEIVLGTCEPGGNNDNCCFDSEWCGDGYCVAGFCVYQDFGGQCIYNDACGLGYTCEGFKEPAVSCQDGGVEFPVMGTCTALGTGGMCQIFTAGLFGDCGNALGWMWNGQDCVEVGGCTCGDACASVFDSYDACLTSCVPPKCCGVDADCGEGLQCFLGHCVGAAPAGTCWSNGDCTGEGEVCVQQSWCSCGQPCKGPIPVPCKKGLPCPVTPSSAYVAPGTCAKAPTCCPKGSECGEGEVCVGPGWSTPACQPAPGPGECWTSSDCTDGEGCVWAAVCGCDLGCEGHTGVCVPLPSACCLADGDCEADEVCSALPPGVPGWSPGYEVGRCVKKTDPTQCFTSAHCGEGQMCQGQGAFLCGAAGGVPWGYCGPADGACCQTDAQCPAGYRCTGAAGFEPQTCRPIPTDGSCWDTTDCDADSFCMGATPAWSCGSPDVGQQKGECAPIAGNCCLSDAECDGGQWCTAKPDNGEQSFPGSQVGQCMAPLGPGACFTSAQCNPGESCSGFMGMPCGKTALYTGYCVPAEQMCCTVDAACPDGWYCAGEGVAGIPGACKQTPEAGTCWENDDCDVGETCVGAAVCGPCMPCKVGGATLGTCQGK